MSRARASGQNRSTAVMQRRVEAPDSLDDFPTPPWAARALCTHVLPAIAGPTEDLVAWEPAANRGYLLRGLLDHFGAVYGSDIHDYSAEAAIAGIRPGVDFLHPGSEPNGEPVDWIITNPPFRLAAEFVWRALALQPRYGVALFVRSAFTEGEERYHTLFAKKKPRADAQFAERVVLHKGTLREPGSLYWDAEAGKVKTASTATAYSWLVWSTTPSSSCERLWIPPCRRMLERPGDYPPEISPVPAAEAPLLERTAP